MCVCVCVCIACDSVDSILGCYCKSYAELCDVVCGLCRNLLAQFSVHKRTDPVFFVCSESVQCSTKLLCAISNPIIILSTRLGNLFANIANLDQDSITSMDSCKIGEALTDKCHQSYSKYKTRYQRINDITNEDKELLSL